MPNSYKPHLKKHSFTGDTDHDFEGLIAGELLKFNGSSIVSAGNISGGTPSFSEVLNTGNVTNGKNIIVSTGDTIAGLIGHKLELNNKVKVNFGVGGSLIDVTGSYLGYFPSTANTQNFSFSLSTVPPEIYGFPINIAQISADYIQLLNFSDTGYIGQLLTIDSNGVLTTTQPYVPERIGITNITYFNILNVFYELGKLVIIVSQYFYANTSADYSNNFKCFTDLSQSSEYTINTTQMSPNTYRIEIDWASFGTGNQEVYVVAEDASSPNFNRCSSNVYLDVNFSGNTLNGWIVHSNSFSSYFYLNSGNFPINSFYNQYGITKFGSLASYDRSGEIYFASYSKDFQNLYHIKADYDKFPKLQSLDTERRLGSPDAYYITSECDLSSFSGMPSSIRLITSIAIDFGPVA